VSFLNRDNAINSNIRDCVFGTRCVNGASWSCAGEHTVRSFLAPISTLLQFTALGIMYQPASFSVAPQHAHHDENTVEILATQPSFVIPGSKAS